MSEAHTPGPWSAVPCKGAFCIESDADALTIASIEVLHSVRDAKEQQANARLIAAAPELLAIVKEALVMTQANNLDRKYAVIVAEWERVISKATKGAL
jgi:hypothetical protein